MPAYSHPLALSAVETESLRMLRARLNKPASGEAAKAVLGKVFLETVARSGLDAPLPAAEEAFAAPSALIVEAHGADMATLRRLCGRIAQLRASDPRGHAAALDAKLHQSIISRRLALAGREPAKTGD